MGLIDWDGDGVEPSETARAAAVAHWWLDEEGGSGGDPQRPEGGCSCRALAIAAAVAVVLIVAASFGVHAFG